MYCLYFQVKQQMIRFDIEDKLESDGLQTITIPVKNFRWYEEDREIIVNGTMFDVKSIHRSNDNYIITGLYDEEETALHIAMGRLRNTGAPDAHLIPVILSQTLIFTAIEDIVPFLQPDELAYRVNYPDEMLYNTFLSIQTPPPRA